MNDTPTELILSKIPDAKKSGKGWSARCPTHDDRHPSLSVAEGEDGRVLLNCHAGCTFKAIVAAMGIAEEKARQRNWERGFTELKVFYKKLTGHEYQESS